MPPKEQPGKTNKWWKEPMRAHWELVVKALELNWLDPLREKTEVGKCGSGYGLMEFYDICKRNRR